MRPRPRAPERSYALDLPPLDTAKKAARAREEDGDHDEEGDGVADARGQVERRQILDDPEEHTPHHRARHRAKAPEHGRREAVDGDQSHLGREERHWREEHAPHRLPRPDARPRDALPRHALRARHARKSITRASIRPREAQMIPRDTGAILTGPKL